MAGRFRRWLFLLLFAGLGSAGAEGPPPIVAIGFYTPVVRDFARQDVEVSLRFWIEELSRTLKLAYKPVRFYESMAEIRRDMTAGNINFVVGTSVDIAQNFPVKELADGFSGYNSEPDHLLLVVRRDSGIQSPADLAGKRVVLMERDKLSEIYLETLLLQAWGKLDWQRLAPLGYEQRSSKLAHRLFFKQADAALIYRNGYDAALALNPQIHEQLRVLEDYSLKIRSPHIGLFSAQVRPEHRSLVTEAAMKLNGTARGRQVLQIYQAENIVPTRVGDLAPFERLLETHRALKPASPTPKKKAKP
jgi:hypothetical protein